MFLGLSKQNKLSLAQGKFLRKRRLAELNLKMSEKETPGDGSCLFHAILDQIQSILELQDYPITLNFAVRLSVMGTKCS